MTMKRLSSQPAGYFVYLSVLFFTALVVLDLLIFNQPVNIVQNIGFSVIGACLFMIIKFWHLFPGTNKKQD
ncbi:hypothetical protein [Alkalicoccus luteus]|nr:hypothetical protein [Alkalicoccus luteus]